MGAGVAAGAAPAPSGNPFAKKAGKPPAKKSAGKKKAGKKVSGK